MRDLAILMGVPIFAASLFACAGKPVQDVAFPFEFDARRADVEATWAKKTPGIITDLNQARDAGSVLVTTRPDYDVEGGAREYLVSHYSHEGQKLWSNIVQHQVKSQDIARDGSLAVTVTYNNELVAWDDRGKKVWSVPSICRPYVLATVKKILCFHDDDARADSAFDIYDWSGTKKSSFPIKLDALILKVSDDETRFALGLTRGQVLQFAHHSEKPVWQKRVPGEIADLAVSGGPSAAVAVLYVAPRVGQRIAWFDDRGKLVSEAAPSVHVTQIEMASDGKSLFAYGNGPRGQSLAYLEVTSGGLVERWTRGDSRFADYSSPMSPSGELALIGFEDFASGHRRSRLLAFTRQGTVRWSVPLKTSQGAYLYSQSYSPARSILVVATDDSMLVGYRITEPAPVSR